ncbi:uncharacterized protein EI97DRAFT_457454 [Westerdykella ornata]|uniref:Uncharacterized protein n=1 Tax=Westerdykella ornata TaxID=318751 RepID=A0A6A6JP28_WESOR|nr:uncharacterized protein EI97DRAFT_457454 [Westerdykella ornata]KAF2277436.1 hypothetical protein EI97DRAFT_457454 [Westerdykella ornata]
MARLRKGPGFGLSTKERDDDASRFAIAEQGQPTVDGKSVKQAQTRANTQAGNWQVEWLAGWRAVQEQLTATTGAVERGLVEEEAKKRKESEGEQSEPLEAQLAMTKERRAWACERAGGRKRGAEVERRRGGRLAGVR